MMKHLKNLIHAPFRTSRAKRLAFAVLATVSLLSCMDNSLVSSGGCEQDGLEGDANMYLSVNVPRTSFAMGSYANKESLVETLDVLVFARGKADPDKYFVHAACKGVLTKDANKFQVVMPVGSDFIVHVFANCREAMVEKKFYNSRGREMDAMLADLIEVTDVNSEDVTALPMHGYVKNITIDKSQVNTVLNVPVLRPEYSFRRCRSLWSLPARQPPSAAQEHSKRCLPATCR